MDIFGLQSKLQRSMNTWWSEVLIMVRGFERDSKEEDLNIDSLIRADGGEHHNDPPLIGEANDQVVKKNNSRVEVGMEGLPLGGCGPGGARQH